MVTVSVEAWMGHATAVLSGTWGALVVPSGAVPRRAPVGRWGQPVAAHSRRRLAGLARACQGWVLRWCLEAIFCHRAPILMAVEPASRAWVAGQRGPERTGARWREVRATWPCLAHLIADGGKGRERGVKWAHAARHAQVPDPAPRSRPPLTLRLDVWHTQRERERVVQRQWKQAERQLEAVRAAEATVDQEKPRGRDARGSAGQSWRAWRQAERRFEEAVHAASAVEPSTSVLAWCAPEGSLGTRARAPAQRRQASAPLPGQQWNQV